MLTVPAFGQLISPGPCPQLDMMPNFQLDFYMGVWYGYKRHKSTTKAKECVRNVYTKAEDGGFRFSTLIITRVNKTMTKLEYTGKMTPITKRESENRFYVQIDGKFLSKPYDILFTNYWSYAIIYSCEVVQRSDKSQGIIDSHEQYLFILTRSWHVTQSLEKEIKLKLRYYRLNPQNLEKTYDDQTCLRGEKKKKEKKKKRISPGLCPEHTAMQNFELKPYMGDWREYKMFVPLPGDMKCVRHKYDISVSGSFWFAIEGIAEVNNATKTLKYTGYMVPFAMEGSNQPARFRFQNNNEYLPSDTLPIYDILYADYKRYAIIYGCENFQRFEESKLKDFHEENYIILVRLEAVSPALEQEINKKVKALGLKPKKLKKTYDDQTCPKEK